MADHKADHTRPQTYIPDVEKAPSSENAAPTREGPQEHLESADSKEQHHSDTASPPSPQSLDLDPPAAVPANGEVQEPAKAEAQEEKGKRSRARVALIMVALCMAVFLAALDVTIITTAAPTIAEHFQSTAAFTWIGSAYLLANSASTPLWGKISDIWGRKPILLLANVVFCVGSLLAAVAVSTGMLIVGRAVQGLGGGGLIVLVNICISDLFPMRTRSIYFACVGAVWAVASSLGPIVGGVFTREVSWRWCFYINLPLDGVAFLIILFFLDLQTPKTPFWDGIRAIDWLGALSIVAGTLMLLLGLEFGGATFPWRSATVIALILAGTLTLALFLVNEWKLARYPIMPLRLFRLRTNWAAFGVCSVHGAVFIAGSYFLPLYFQAVLGADPLLSGVYLLPTAVSLSATSLFAGFYIRKTGRYRPPIWAGMFLLTVGYGLNIDLRQTTPSWPRLIIYQVIAGLGTGPIFQAPLLALQNFVPPRDIATATAAFGFARNLATAVSVVVGTAIFQNAMAAHYPALARDLPPRDAVLLGLTPPPPTGGAPPLPPQQHHGPVSAFASTTLISSLPPRSALLVRAAAADSLSKMWIFYAALSAVGFAVSFAIGKKEMSRTLVAARTGLEGEKERAREAAEEKRERRERKAEREAGREAEREAGREAKREAEKV